MIIRHDAVVLVADGKKYLLLRNTGAIGRPELTYEGGGAQENPATAQQGSDQPGRAFKGDGCRGREPISHPRAADRAIAVVLV